MASFEKDSSTRDFQLFVFAFFFVKNPEQEFATILEASSENDFSKRTKNNLSLIHSDILL